jgi:hypothetical protein
MFPGPVVPYIREADFAIRKPWYTPPRRWFDYTTRQWTKRTMTRSCNRPTTADR